MTTKTRQGPAGWLRSLASLRLAVVLLAVLAAVLAIATIVESRRGAEVAQRIVYHALWFDLLLLLLGVNIAAAAIIRWPWRPRQVGFVVTHIALLTILGGCLTTSWFGTTGRVVLVEGQQDNHVLQDAWVIQATSHGPGGHAPAVQVPIDQPPAAGQVTTFELTGRTYSMKVLQYLPNAEVRSQIVEGADGDPAAVLVELADPHANTRDPAGRIPQQWLLSDDKGQWAINAPGFALAAASRYTPPAASQPSGPAKGTLVATIDGREYEVDVEKAMAGPQAIADGRATLSVSGYFEHPTVGAGGLQEDPERPANPAVVVQLTEGGKTERRIIYAKFGDFSAMHGGGKEQTVKMSFRHSGSARSGMNLVLVPQQGKWVLYEDDGSKVLQQADLQPDTPVALKGMPVSLTVRKALSHGRPGRSVQARKATKDSDAQPAIEVELAGPEGKRRDWLAWAQPATFAVGRGPVQLTLQARTAVLPFAIHLDKFEVERYAGSQMPAMYRSEVTVSDTELREKRSVTIEMNQPLEYRGWSFFQSSYNTTGDGRNVSILAASKDPGKPIVYVGAILLVLGTTILAIQRLRAQAPAVQAAAKTTNKESIVVETRHA